MKLTFPIHKIDSIDSLRKPQGRERHSVRAVSTFAKPRRARRDAPYHQGQPCDSAQCSNSVELGLSLKSGFDSPSMLMKNLSLFRALALSLAVVFLLLA